MFIEGLLGHEKTQNKSADVIWRGFDVICVCPLIDHGQQSMKKHTEVRRCCINAITLTRKIITKIKLNHITHEKRSKASLPISHCDPVKPVGHSHFLENALHVLLCLHLTQLQLKD